MQILTNTDHLPWRTNG